MKTVVVGQGYVGLPVAMRAVEVGHTVVGIDLDEARTGLLREGKSYVDDISDATLMAALESGRYLATTNYEDVTGFDFAVITVPTPLRESLPDLSFIEQSAASLAPYLRAGATVVLESTTYPGTTEELLVPLLEAGSGLTAGQDFSVGYSPERIDPGNPTWGFVTTPKVVAGIDAPSLVAVQGFYDQLVTTTVPVSGTREAELTKLLENTFRHVNIALVNELAMFANQLGVDVWESIEAASTKPFGFMKFTPGPGVGGHCLPVDPSYLSWQVRKQLGRPFRFVELANDVNDHMPNYVVERVIAMLNGISKSVRGTRILLIGLAYKPGTGDVREAPSMAMIELLLELGADLVAVDEHVEEHRWPQGVERVSLDAETLARVDLSVIVTAHPDVDLTVLAQSDVLVLDTRNTRSVPTAEVL
ncbi:nucleotide sugar dehydrogenase [Frigoribacterium sp. MCBA15_019]|uniref:nucleotide sugar dehydrogenase n=1 Tax=Frigoribacterium sp. MCBA15_019 TaxID=1898745 RepID=UPI0008DCDE48|nr:nucleotide sugar dehydrogenase [Frigoribacterium sp. MCBA15_019]OII27602.1 UDP-N-acetyl-D-glucosamine dehydrogenase [Frigoribacterium sp. MCBA15_019]